MPTQIFFSIIVNNFNYGRFLREAIDSALAQEYSHFEVIVVDDGSTDDSRAIIASYGAKIKSLLKPNGGQASALNAGFAISSGNAVLFLDADDVLLPQALANAAPLLEPAGVSKVQWPMWLVDSTTRRTGGIRPMHALPEGNLREQVIERGLSNVPSSPTSGNIWSRALLERILPMPEDVYRLCADDYLYTLAPVFGIVRTLRQPQGYYRLHGSNSYSSGSFDEKLQTELRGYDAQCEALKRTLERHGISVDLTSWKRHSWFHRVERAVKELLSTVPEGHEFVLVDGNSWGLEESLQGRRPKPFLDESGVDLGPPANDQAALKGLSRLLEKGICFLAIAWPCFWWFDEYPELFALLNQLGKRTVESEETVIYHIPPMSHLPNAVC